MGFLILVSSTVTDTFYYPFWMTLMSEYILVKGTLINKYLMKQGDHVIAFSKLIFH